MSKGEVVARRTAGCVAMMANGHLPPLAITLQQSNSRPILKGQKLKRVAEIR
jgi:hypothetical protein